MHSRAVLVSLLACLASACDDDRGARSLPAEGADLARASLDLSSAVDFAGLDLTPPSCEPCLVSGPGTFCGLDIAIAPFVAGGVLGGFQSDPGTGASHEITITLSASIRWIEVQLLDPDFAGNRLETFDASDQPVSSVDFPYDNQPGSLTKALEGAGGQLIKKVKLIPAPLDYVAYDKLRVIPEGCDAPVL